MVEFDFGQTGISNEKLVTENGVEINIEKYHFKFKKWKEIHNFDTYNGKMLLELNNEPLFAELLMLRILEEQGYTGVWVDTYRNKYWKKLPSLSLPVDLDEKLKKRFEEIYKNKNGKKSGCFDILAYKNENFISVELKRKKKDKIQDSQIKWLESALKLEIKNHKYIIAEWETD